VILFGQHFVDGGGVFEQDEPESFGAANLVLFDGVFFDGSVLGEIFAKFIFSAISDIDKPSK